MRTIKLLTTLACLLAAVTMSAQSPIAVDWHMGQNNTSANNYSSRFVIKNISNQPLGDNWQFFFNQFSRQVTVPAGCPVDIEEVSTTYYRVKPNGNYKPIAASDSLVVEMVMGGAVINKCYMPAGGHVVMGGDMAHPIAVNINRSPLDKPGQWRDHKAYPDGNYMYSYNEAINGFGDGYTGNDYDIFPTPKQVDIEDGFTQVGSIVTIKYGKFFQWGGYSRAKNLLTNELEKRGIYVASGQNTVIELLLDKKMSTNREYYSLRVHDGRISIHGATSAGLINGVKTLIAALDHSKGNRLQNCFVIDWPDFGYRGMHFDIARNYVAGPAEMKRLIDLLAYYKINTLQFHFTDDEAWRLEIPGLPELTQVASRRGATLDEKGYLAQIFDGNGNPDDLSQCANGYLTRSEFIDLLRYAWQRGVNIIPEIETPGHARAAIVAMKNRAANNPTAQQYRLWDEKNESVYTSAQSYHDNVLNVASDDVYLFIDHVVGELQQMYKEAGLKLEVVHLGGDEVARGAWDKSPDVQALMQGEGLKDQHDVHAYFLKRISALLEARKIRIEGWQEVGLDNTPEYNALMIPRVAGVNAWSTVGSRADVPYRLANDGYPVILSNVTNFYMDMGYSWHQNEQGLHWGGKVDEIDAWNALPANIYASARTATDGTPIDITTAAEGKVKLEKPNNIIGIQAQLWGETLRNFDQVQYMLLPKMMGVSERAWNAIPEWSKDLTDIKTYNDARHQYNLKIGTRELPLLHGKGFNFRVGPPGIKVIDGMLHINTQYPDEMVTYTTDGSEPTIDSPRWTAPVRIKTQPQVIKAKAFYLGHESVTTYLFK
ncbi:MAG: family 20 glycosylhydrolase [Muribaculaceae bacterium]|nr:family 20 glycosylhydrolase [Muribaculaceae bacterium]